jgi:exodeoxyribonuclease VIII
MTVPITPGIYHGLELEEYAAIPAVNQSSLKAIAKSPLHYRHRLDNGIAPTPPMRLGAIAHCACLEYDALLSRYRVYEPPDGKPDRFAGKHYDAFVEAEAVLGRTVIKQRELDAALRIRSALLASKPAARYLARGTAEVVLVWRDAATQILCKARIDWLSLSVPDVLVELKTARDTGPWVFSTAFARSGYDVQAAFYHDGYAACTGREPGGKCIAIENVEPHDTVVYDLNEVIDTGREIYRGYLTRLAECRKSGEWLGQAATDEQILRLPKWRDPSGDDEADVFAELGLEAAP